ncbi:aromatic-L-amino-acid decarboxylase-like [Trichogramma pretiosum]|uniref:aromatic-L-amino-acid decarboxylase-like n=1 Tax=Trichogramma pretiosum TaxID=7493 RepID=UPI0006C9B4DD|nr:aromatic-L-amino-acid decarboxylase-like [Trichogramma pretiosum]
MDLQEFSFRGKEMIDYICEFMSNIHRRRVTPDVEPGYLRPLLPAEPPEQPESWEVIMDDVEKKIMPGITHWQHPRFHAYFPSGNSFPSILGDMLSDAIGCIGFSWAASPACTELETIVCDWLGKAIGLPSDFLYFSDGSRGGGVLQGSASECILVSMLAARAQAIARLKEMTTYENQDETVLLGKLMAYCSRESHSCVEKNAMISFVKLRILEPDSESILRGTTLKQAMEADIAEGYVPFFVSITLGTTACCSFDDLQQIGLICQQYSGIWLHVDAAYAGNAFICPELQYLLAGIEFADSFNMNPNKFLLTNFDCSMLWVKDRFKLTSALVVDPLYLQHTHVDTAIDYRHWSIPLSRRFRSLKLWFVIRNYGISGLQKYIRNHIKLAKRFESLVKKDSRFELCNKVVLGLVCFRIKGSDTLNQKFLSAINASGKLHMVPAKVNHRYTIRFALAAPNASDKDVDIAWEIVSEMFTEIQESKDLMDDVLTINEKKRKITLEQRRSFFVRMVSDPAIQPGFTKTPNRSQVATLFKDNNSPQNTTHTWISWPFSYLMQTRETTDNNELSLRFRHLDTMVRLKSNISAQKGDTKDEISELTSNNSSLITFYKKH